MTSPPPADVVGGDWRAVVEVGEREWATFGASTWRKDPVSAAQLVRLAEASEEDVMAQERTMLTFTAGVWRFTYRVGAVVLRAGHVLLTRASSGDYWFTPGGRVEAGESARAAMERELVEELGVGGQVERLLWTNENFFRTGETLHHELVLYFLVGLAADAHSDLSRTFHSRENGTSFVFAWHPLADLRGIRLVPPFLAGALANLPQTTEHIVSVDPSAAEFVNIAGR